MRLVGPTLLGFCRRQARDQLQHEATLERDTRVRIPGSAGQYLSTWVARRPQPARLRPAGGGDSTLRLDQLAAIGDWLLQLEAGSVVAVGERVLVRGAIETDRAVVRWQRLLRVQRVGGPEADELLRAVLCTDEELNP